MAVIDGSGGNDLFLVGTSLADTIRAFGGNDVAYGGGGNDTILAAEGDDIGHGGAGNDTLDGGQGRDLLFGDDGNDALFGGLGDDALYGGTGNDALAGGAGNDLIFGQAGNDAIFADAGSDSIDGGAGLDLLSYAGGTAGVSIDLLAGSAWGGGFLGVDRISGIETVHGTGFGDVFQAGATASSFFGFGGDDTVRLRGAGGVFDGGQGSDSLDLSATGQAAAVNLETGFAGAGQTISGFENLVGTAFGDVLTGSAARNALSGGAGGDTIAGDGGNDLIRGGAGRDQLSGGAGSDVFDFDLTTESGPGAAARDRIADFTGADWIDLSTIDAQPGAGGNEAFAFIGEAAFSAVGQVRFHHEAGRTIVEVNTSGTGAGEMEIEIAGRIKLLASDFVL